MNHALFKKLLMKPGTPFAVVGAPREHAVWYGDAAPVRAADVVLLYAVNAAELEKRLPAVTRSVGGEARLWVVYPKAKKLGTDLNRDMLCELVAPHGLRPVRMIAMDTTWSALWFKRTP